VYDITSFVVEVEEEAVDDDSLSVEWGDDDRK
jgi:hypothetical protein